MSVSTSDNSSTRLTDGPTQTTKGSDSSGSTGTSSSNTIRHTDIGSTGSETTQETTPIFSTEGTTTTIILPEPPKVQPPLVDYHPTYYPTTKPPRRRPERVTSETSEIVALIIGIIAGVLIAIILIILLILRFKSRGERSYKVDDGKGYLHQQGPNAALLGNTSSNNSNGQTQYQVNGALRNGDKNQLQQKTSKKRDSKDIKEWYV